VVDGRLVLLGLIVGIAVVVARDLEPTPPPAVLARERAADAVLVEIDRTQQCYFRRRERYTDSIPSLQFARGRFVRTALVNDLDIELRTVPGGYVQRITGEGVDALLERRGTKVVRLDVGDRPAPRLARGC
jgi:hypothetical protein